MKMWRQLYLIVWLAFLQIVIILIPEFGRDLVDVHAILGLIILALAHYNYAQLKRTSTPNRLKRIAKSTAILATVQVILGIILYADIRLMVNVPLAGVIIFLHLVIALAIITQTSSVATAYDMWEDREFANEKS
jgi:heme A synthase